MRTREKWRQILGDGKFKRGDYVKFKWGDFRYRKKIATEPKLPRCVPKYSVTQWVERKTWVYGIVSRVCSDGDGYIVKVIKGSSHKGSLHAQGEIRPWYPRKN